ncbi:hypothetical protein T492DRAFT_843734 [Pavlovales sp. CCMP2436]|nr:hypothetical protein T492DRAFT_843734 [Pavlovales sp. CCMP2436]
MAGKKRKSPTDALQRAAVVTGDGADDDADDAALLPSGLPRPSLKLPKGTLPEPPKVKLPSAAEQLAMRGATDGAELAASNLLHMQLEALLDEVTVDYAKGATQPLDDWLRSFREALLALPAAEPIVDGDALPLATELEPLAWRPPVRVVLTGSYLLRTQMQAGADGLNIDLAIELPSRCLKAKDHLDGRYGTRRQLWLHHLAVLLSHPDSPEAWEPAPDDGAETDEAETAEAAREAIRAAAALCEGVHVISYGGDSTWPILAISPKGLPHCLGQSRPLTIRLLPFVGLETFPPNRLRPARCCVRPHKSAANAPAGLATPRYNARLLSEAAHVPALQAMHSVFAADSRGSLRDAAVLLKGEREVLRGSSDDTLHKTS